MSLKNMLFIVLILVCQHISIIYYLKALYQHKAFLYVSLHNCSDLLRVTAHATMAYEIIAPKIAENGEALGFY